MKIQRAALVVALTAAIVAAGAISIYYVNFLSRPSSSKSTTVPGGTSSSATTSSGATGLWTTYHYDNSRSGYDPNEPQIGTPSFEWASPNLDGLVYSEPLLANKMVFIATENDSVYALNETTGSLIWRTNLGQAVSGSTLPCGDVDPSGITNTPVINATSGLIYVVAFVQPHSHDLFALDLNNGTIRFQRNVDPSGADPTVQQQRAALAMANGMIYIAYGGLDGDCGNYYGVVVGVHSNGAGSIVAYAEPNGSDIQGGIWAPSGPAIDSSGKIYVTTGNSNGVSAFDYGDSVISLSPNLNVLSYFAPTDWSSLNAGDTDLGSTGPSILGGNLLFQIGKEGTGYLLSDSNLGGVGGQIFSNSICNGAYGGNAYANTYLYVPCDNGLFALEVNVGTSSFSATWSDTGFFAGPPIVAGGAVWSVDTDNTTLLTLSAQSGAPIFHYNLGSVVHFETPASGNGLVYVGAGSSIDAFNIN